MKILGKGYLLAVFLILFLNSFSVIAAENLEIIYKDGLVTVTAEEAMPEDIFIEFGRECNVEIIVKGEKFSKNGVTLEFRNWPVKAAVKRLVKACGIKNYLMDSKNDSLGVSRLVKIDLSVGGSGQRVLTRATKKTVKKTLKKTTKSSAPDKKKKQLKEPYKRSFSKDTDFQWDGSAPIAFPEFKGELAYDKSEFSWDENAKSFSENTMDLVPPGVRTMVSEQIINMSDQIAKERGTDIITPDITAEAVERIGKQASMPPNVMNLMPKSAEDFDKPRIPIDSDQLKEEYRD